MAKTTRDFDQYVNDLQEAMSLLWPGQLPSNAEEREQVVRVAEALRAARGTSEDPTVTTPEDFALARWLHQTFRNSLIDWEKLGYIGQRQWVAGAKALRKDLPELFR